MVQPNKKRKYNSTSWEEVLAACEYVNLEPLFSYEDFDNQRQTLSFRCKNESCMSEIKKTLGKIMNGQGCGNCSTSLYERQVRIAFECIFGAEFPTLYPPSLKNYQGNRMHLDGYSKELSIAWEHQGDYHYNPQSYQYRHLNDNERWTELGKRIENDVIKEVWCATQEPRIHLIQVPCLELDLKLRDLRSYILRELDSQGIRYPDEAKNVVIDYSKAYRHDPRLKWIEKFQTLNIDTELKSWVGTAAQYLFACRECGHGWKGWLTNVNCCPECSRKERVLDEDEMLKSLQELANELGRSPFAFEVDKCSDCASVNSYARHFGSFNAALKAAELSVSRASKYTEEVLLEKLCERFAKSETISYTEVNEANDFPAVTTFNKVFGSLSSAVEKIGKYYVERKEYNKQELIRLLQEFHGKTGRAPVQRELCADNNLPAIDTFISHFGSYNAALKEAELPVNRVTNRTDEELIDALKSLGKRKGRKPTGKDIDNEPGMATSRTYHERFGSLQSAFRLAGF